MFNISANKRNNNGRVLMFSLRNIYKKYHFMSSAYEFEDIIRQIESVEWLTPKYKKEIEYNSKSIAISIAKHFGIIVNSGLPKIKIKKEYDLFFAVCHLPRDLFYINTLEGWNDYCKTSICWLNEIWVKEISRLGHLYKSFLKILSKFDYVVIGCSQSVKAVNEAARAECFYSPPGIDAILFCPYPEMPPRFIDVCSVGRRSEKTHHALLKLLKDKKIYYIFDSINGDKIFNPKHHRLLFANTVKRSRFFIVNIGKIDSLSETGGQSEIGPRFFEGAASGTIMIGDFPKTEEFKKNFNWPDAVVYLPFGSDNIGKVIQEMDMNPDHQAQIRRNNVVNSLLHHDWVYRWETLLKTTGLKPMQELLERKKQLKQLSETIEEL